MRGRHLFQLSILFLLFLGLSFQTTQAQQAPFEDPIDLIGHGNMYDKYGQLIEPTPEFLARTQQLYLQTLMEIARPDTIERVRTYLKSIDEASEKIAKDSEDSRFLNLKGTSRVLRSLVGEIDAAERPRMHGRILEAKIDEIFKEISPRLMQDDFRKVLGEIPIASRITQFSTATNSAEYEAECQANGVPIPPAWNRNGGGWVHSGDVSWTSAGVYKYKSTSPEGACIALPRPATGQTGLLGIICQGKQSSKACFWDNQMNAETFSIGENEIVPLSNFGGGPELAKLNDMGNNAGGTCTRCHAGENAFLLRPNTPLGYPALSDLPLQADNWVDFLVDPNWPQNPGPSLAIPGIPGIASCTGCHSQEGAGPGNMGGRFPDLSNAISGYCGVLSTAVNEYMPTGGGGSQAGSAHVLAMQALCSAEAEPLLRIEDEVINYGQVEEGFSFARALVLHNDGNANLTVEVNRLTPAGDPNLDHWSEVNELASTVIAPGAAPVVLRQVYEPDALGAHAIQLQVVSNDGSAPSTVINLTGEGVAPRPIDTVLVLDRSGSMSDLAGDQTKIEAMRNSVMLYTDLMRESAGDKLGFVKYNDTNSVYFPLTTITNGQKNAIEADELSSAALNDLARLRPDGATGIGGAMLKAADEVGGPNPDRGSVVVVLTDGIENEEPYIASAVADIQANDGHIQMYSVGLGFDIEPGKLQSITNMGDQGYHQVTNTLRDETLFDLEAFYFKIFASAANMDMVTDPTHIVNLASTTPVVVDRGRVISSDRNATFLVLEDPMMRPFYDLEFVAPDGQVLSPGVSVGGIPIQEQLRNNYRIYRIIFPDQSQAATYVGDWILRLVPNGKWNRDVAKGQQGESRYGYDGFMQPVGGQVPIGFAGAVSSDYNLDAQVSTTSFLPGATLKFSARLTDRGWPAPDGTISVRVTRPDGSVQTVSLFDDGAHDDGSAGDANWAKGYAQTAQQGVYRLLFRSVGKNERGELAPRLVERYVTLGEVEPTPDDDPQGSDPGGRTSCNNCEGSAASYLIGNFDVRNERNTLVNIMNPTERPLGLIISLFDQDGQPFQCVRDKIGPNALRSLNLRRLDLESAQGVIKIVSVDPNKQTPVVGIVGNQILTSERGLTETGLHPISPAILKGDFDRIVKLCR